jgi:hypothetical protein
MSGKGLLRKPSTSQNEKLNIVGTNSSSNKQTIVNRKCSPGFMLPNESAEENSELESPTDNQAAMYLVTVYHHNAVTIHPVKIDSFLKYQYIH